MDCGAGDVMYVAELGGEVSAPDELGVDAAATSEGGGGSGGGGSGSRKLNAEDVVEDRVLAASWPG